MTFEKDLTYLSTLPVQGEPGKLELQPLTKKAVFYELSQTDPRQHKLFFLMMPLWQEVKNVGSDKAQFIANPEILHDLTLKAVDCLLKVGENGFNEMDKREFLNDGFAVLAFGKWFLEEKFTGFFLNFMNNYMK